MYSLDNTVIDDVLCYITSSRNSITNDSIIVNAAGFYKPEIVRKSKELIFKICNERVIARKATTNRPNTAIPDVQDILDLIEKMENKSFLFPVFVAGSYNSLPPSSGFESLAAVMCSLRDEILALRTEVKELRENSQKDVRCLDDVGCVKQDVADIKTLMHESRQNVRAPQYAEVVSSRPQLSNPEVNTQSVTQNSSQQVFDQNRINSNEAPTRGAQTNPTRGGGRSGRGGARGLRSASTRQDPPGRRANVVGTSVEAAGSGGLSGVERILDVFVGGCDKNTTVSDLENYCSTNDFRIEKCEALTTRSEWYNAFKISVLATKRDELLKPEFWPVGIFVRKFFKSRALRNND